MFDFESKIYLPAMQPLMYFPISDIVVEQRFEEKGLLRIQN